LDVRLTHLLCRKKKNVAKSKEVRTGWSHSRQIWQNLLRKAAADADNDDDDDDDETASVV
jgi:hypothetical protein